jgi:RNA polymerase sigma factor (sigma-70 family)
MSVERLKDTTPQLPSDQELVASALNNGKDAFKLLMQRHSSHLYYFVVRRVPDASDAYDVVQETFISVWQSLRRYDPMRSFSVWLRHIALNKCRDRARAAFVRRIIRRIGDVDPAIVDNVPDPAPVGEDALSADTDRKRVRLALQALPEHLREPLLLTIWEGMSQKEAAEVLKIDVKSFENRLYRAKQKLKAMMMPTSAD